MSILNYIKETKAELKHVNWLSQKEVISYTVLVIGVCVFIALLLGAFDLGLTESLNQFINYVK